MLKKVITFNMFSIWLSKAVDARRVVLGDVISLHLDTKVLSHGMVFDLLAEQLPNVVLESTIKNSMCMLRISKVVTVCTTCSNDLNTTITCDGIIFQLLANQTTKADPSHWIHGVRKLRICVRR